MTIKTSASSETAITDYQSVNRFTLPLRGSSCIRGKKTAKSGGAPPKQAMTARRDELPPTDRRVMCEYTSRRKGGRCREWRSSDPRATGANTSRRKKTEIAKVAQRDKRFLRKKTTERTRSTRFGLGYLSRKSRQHTVRNCIDDAKRHVFDNLC